MSRRSISIANTPNEIKKEDTMMGRETKDILRSFNSWQLSGENIFYCRYSTVAQAALKLISFQLKITLI